jgi:hypothetical protein
VLTAVRLGVLVRVMGGVREGAAVTEPVDVEDKVLEGVVLGVAVLVWEQLAVAELDMVAVIENGALTYRAGASASVPAAIVVLHMTT